MQASTSLLLISNVDMPQYKLCAKEKQEVLERTNLPTFLKLFKNVICIKTSV
jgi:hypothetical protein